MARPARRQAMGTRRRHAPRHRSAVAQRGGGEMTTVLEAMTEAVGGKTAIALGTTADPQQVVDRLAAAGFAVVPVTELEMIADIGEGSTTANSLPHIARRIRAMLRAAARG